MGWCGQERTRLFIGRARLCPLRSGASGMCVASAVSTIYISRDSLVKSYCKRYLYIGETFADCAPRVSSCSVGKTLETNVSCLLFSIASHFLPDLNTTFSWSNIRINNGSLLICDISFATLETRSWTLSNPWYVILGCGVVRKEMYNFLSSRCMQTMVQWFEAASFNVIVGVRFTQCAIFQLHLL